MGDPSPPIEGSSKQAGLPERLADCTWEFLPEFLKTRHGFCHEATLAKLTKERVGGHQLLKLLPELKFDVENDKALREIVERENDKCV